MNIEVMVWKSHRLAGWVAAFRNSDICDNAANTAVTTLRNDGGEQLCSRRQPRVYAVKKRLAYKEGAMLKFRMTGSQLMTLLRKLKKRGCTFSWSGDSSAEVDSVVAYSAYFRISFSVRLSDETALQVLPTRDSEWNIDLVDLERDGAQHIETRLLVIQQSPWSLQLMDSALNVCLAADGQHRCHPEHI